MPPSSSGALGAASLLRAGRSLTETLDAVGAAIAESMGFRTVAVNLHRPAFDDFEIVAVHGRPEARAALLGTATSADEWRRLLDPRFRRGGAYVVEHGTFDWSADFSVTYVPSAGAPPASPGQAWHPEDAIFVPLESTDGTVLGVLSVDEPLSGLRPSQERLDELAAVTAEAGLAVEAAQHAEESRRHRAAVEHLLRVSARLTEQRSVDDVLAAVCEAVRDALGFEKVMVWLADHERLCDRASVGWDAEGPGPVPGAPVAVVERLLTTQPLVEGCLLLDQAAAHAATPPELHSIYRSVRNGRGPRGWSNHWLLVPLHAPDGALAGVVWADDPADRMVPSLERLQVLRAFANQAASALATARHLEQLRHLAEHDPLTGLRNRRGLHERIAEALEDGAAVVVLDIDHFKRINDGLGYEAGDRVLREVATMIAAERRTDDLAVRLGGEEFALVLPGTDERGALAVAERLRRAVHRRVGRLPWPVSLSAGVAAGRRGRPEDLLRDATRALYAAKRLGRDRAVVYASETLETLLSSLEREDATAEHLSAVMMLAETLDLRDAGTARHSHTVGQFARSIAAELDWAPARVERLRVAGALHDIGKLAVADSILHKPGPLTAAERTEIERHPEVGARILERANLRDVASWVACHHERMDGRGYPAGLPEAEIPVEARILAVADAYEAMTADRPYRAGMPPGDARAELCRHAGTQFDGGVVEAFLRVLDRDGEPARPA